MLHIPVSRWGEPYKSLDLDKVVHFDTGEVLAEVSRANGGLVERDMRFAKRARDVLREIPIKDLLNMVKKAADLYTKAELPLGNGTQTPDQFVRMQSATTGLPEHMCRFNMEKNHFVLSGMDKILDALTRGLDLNILARGYGVEERGVPVSYQAQSPVLGMVLPSNSPGVHTLWLPIIPLQVGLVLKPGPQEPWTPYRMAQAFIQAGVPKQAIAIYPGMGDVGAAVLAHCPRSLRASARSSWATTRSITGKNISTSWSIASWSIRAAAASTARECGRPGTPRKSPRPSPPGWARSSHCLPRTPKPPWPPSPSPARPMP